MFGDSIAYEFSREFFVRIGGGDAANPRGYASSSLPSRGQKTPFLDWRKTSASSRHFTGSKYSVCLRLVCLQFFIKRDFSALPKLHRICCDSQGDDNDALQIIYQNATQLGFQTRPSSEKTVLRCSGLFSSCLTIYSPNLKTIR